MRALSTRQHPSVGECLGPLREPQLQVWLRGPGALPPLYRSRPEDEGCQRRAVAATGQAPWRTERLWRSVMSWRARGRLGLRRGQAEQIIGEIAQLLPGEALAPCRHVE